MNYQRTYKEVHEKETKLNKQLQQRKRGEERNTQAPNTPG